MKKAVVLFLSAVLTLSMLTGCGNKNSAETPPESSAPSAAEDTSWMCGPVQLRYATQGAGTSNYTNAATTINLLMKYLPTGSDIVQETISTGNSSVGYLIEAGAADIGQGENAMSATVGLNDRPPYSNISALLATKTEDFVIMIVNPGFEKQTGYTSLREILENQYPATICCEDVGSSDYTCLTYVFDILGYTFEDFEGWGGRIVTTSGDACCEMLQDDQADIMISHCSEESSSIAQLALTTDVLMTTLDDELLDGFKERGFGSATIKAGTFGNRFESDTPSVAIGSSIIVSSDMAEDVAYTLTRIMCEHKDEFGEEISGFRDLSYQAMVDTTATVVPLHPGSVRYFQEISVLDSSGNYVGEPSI